MRHTFPATVLIVSLLSSLSAAFGQTAEERIGDWFFSCPENAECRISQELLHTELNQRVAGVTIVLDNNANPVILIAAPLGVLLPNGLSFELDGQPTSRFSYHYCDADGCQSKLPLAADALDGFRRGSKLTMVTMSTDGQELKFEFSLIGFSKAYNKLASAG